MPAKVFDAMAMAKPIIATNVSDLPEFLDGCGWTVAPEKPKQLADTIQYVFNHSINRKIERQGLNKQMKKAIPFGIMEFVGRLSFFRNSSFF